MFTFYNGCETCVVLAHSGETALIALLDNPTTPFVVPLLYQLGERDWCNGHYFETLEAAMMEYKCRLGETWE